LLFRQLEVVPLTTEQNTPEWFLLWWFSFTSSTSDNLLAEMKKLSLDIKTYHLFNPVNKKGLKKF
jgi:hypothetical protein